MKSQAISFRLSDDKHRRFLGVSAASGLSPGEYARELVMDKIDEAETTKKKLDSLRQEIEEIRSDMAVFQDNFYLALEALLVSNSAGKPISLEQAKRWVDERLRVKTGQARGATG